MSVVNPAEIIKVEDIVVPVTPPLCPRLPHRDTLLLDLLFHGERSTSLLYMGINLKSGRDIKTKSGRPKKSGSVGGQLIQICYKMTKKRPCKNLDSLNSEQISKKR